MLLEGRNTKKYTILSWIDKNNIEINLHTGFGANPELKAI